VPPTSASGTERVLGGGGTIYDDVASDDHVVVRTQTGIAVFGRQ
jgi:hypothetical protein